MLEEIQPEEVFKYFEEITHIPRGSGNTKKIADYLVSFARDRGLKHMRDASDNVIIFKDASAGMKDKKSVILQAHTDMVINKNDMCPADPATSGVKLHIDGDLITAVGSTLGADDGIGMAMILAVLDKCESHPPLECVFTSDEEVGLIGADALDMEALNSGIMINLDSEEDDVITAGCAGGCTIECTIPVFYEEIEQAGNITDTKSCHDAACREKKNSEGTDNNDETLKSPAEDTLKNLTGYAHKDSVVIKIRVEGLSGGHSGVDINKGRLNASMVLGDALKTINRDQKVRIISISGGEADNVITSESEACIVVDDPDGAIKAISLLQKQYLDKAAPEDKNLSITAECMSLLDNTKANGKACSEDFKPLIGDGDICDELLSASVNAAETSSKFFKALNHVSSVKVIEFLDAVPYGVVRMDENIKDLVETSANIGMIRMQDKDISFVLSLRSSVSSRKKELIGAVTRIARSLGGSAKVYGDYPQWEYKEDSPLREHVLRAYKEKFGKEARIDITHAGLECSVFSDKIKDLDCVSIGCNVFDAHTCEESLSISSARAIYELLLKLLAEL